jgi:hypothetical protein
MAELRNDSGALRLALVLVAREAGSAVAERLLVTAALEYLDQRDGEWWPLVRLPPLHLPVVAVERLLTDQADLLRGVSAGFSWRPGADASLGLQVGVVQGGAVLEIGLDLGAFLADVAGVPLRAEEELALFRFRALQQDLVKFSEALGRELEALRR